MSAPVILTSFGWTGEEGSAGGFPLPIQTALPP